MSPTSSSSPLAGRNTRSAVLRTKILLSPGAVRGAKGRSLRDRAKPSEQYHVHAPPPFEVAGAHDSLLLEAEAGGQPAGGGVLGRGGDLDALGPQLGEGPVHQERDGGPARAPPPGGGNEPEAAPRPPVLPGQRVQHHLSQERAPGRGVGDRQPEELAARAQARLAGDVA